MGLRMHRSERASPGASARHRDGGADLRELSSEGSQYLLGAAVLMVLSALVWLYP